MDKTSLDPVTPLRPKDLQAEAVDLIFSRNPDFTKLKNPEQLEASKSRAELLFYRVAEIQARAAIAERLKPDLTLCVHFNAAPDPNPGHPSLFDINKLVIFVNGSYLPEELVFDDIKFDLLKKILERSNPVESAIARDIGNAMEKNWKIPPEAYTNWASATRFTDSPYVWSRNLIANRLYPGPVVFVEGPYMNDRATYDRLQAGDYAGEKIINGVSQKSIFREYAQIIYEGVLAYYTTPPPPPPAPGDPNKPTQAPAPSPPIPAQAPMPTSAAPTDSSMPAPAAPESSPGAPPTNLNGRIFSHPEQENGSDEKEIACDPQAMDPDRFKLTLLKIPVRNLSESARFYRMALGFKEQFVAEEYGWAQFGSRRSIHRALRSRGRRRESANRWQCGLSPFLPGSGNAEGKFG